MGLQYPRELIDPVIVEVNRAIGLADIIILIPLFIIAVIGLWRLKFYGALASWMVLGTSLYWPVIFCSNQYFYDQAGIKHQPTPMSNNVILTLILIFLSGQVGIYSRIIGGLSSCTFHSLMA